MKKQYPPLEYSIRQKLKVNDYISVDFYKKYFVRNTIRVVLDRMYLKLTVATSLAPGKGISIW